MKTFSPSEAAFEGFRVIRSNPGALVVWMVGYLLLLIALGAGLVVLVGPAWEQFAPALAQAKQGDASAFMALAQEMRTFNLLMSPLQFVVTVIFTCAIYRAVLRPHDYGYGFIRLGGREFWVGLLKIVYAIMSFGIGLALVIGCVVLFLILGLASGLGGGAKPGPHLLWLFLLVAIPILLLLIIWLSTRLSLAQPMTFATGRLQLFESWSLTRGKFWSMVGAYILAWIMAFVISLIAVVIVGAVGLILFSPLFPQLMAGTLDWSAPTPRILGACVLGLWVLVGSILGPISHILLMAPGAYIYQSLAFEPDIPLATDGGSIDTPPGVLVL